MREGKRCSGLGGGEDKVAAGAWSELGESGETENEEQGKEGKGDSFVFGGGEKHG